MSAKQYYELEGRLYGLPFCTLKTEYWLVICDFENFLKIMLDNYCAYGLY